MHTSQGTRGLIQIIMLQFVDLILTKIPGKRKKVQEQSFTLSHSLLTLAEILRCTGIQEQHSSYRVISVLWFLVTGKCKSFEESIDI